MVSRLLLAVALVTASPAAAQDVSRALVAVGDVASGVFVDRGLVATAADAIGDRHIVQVRLVPDRVVLAQVVASDERSGVALLRVPADTTPPTPPVLRIDGAARVGDELGVAAAALTGVRRGARVTKVSADRPPSYEVSLPSDANMAGAVLLDGAGRLVAVVTRVGVGSGPAHAASAAAIHALADDPGRWFPARASTRGAPPTDRGARGEAPGATGSPPVSEAARHDAVLKDLDGRLKALAGEMTRLGNLNARYEAACVGQYLAPVGGPWVYPWLIEKAELPECQSLRAEVERRLAEARTSLADIEETARHAGVLPGELRDLVRRNGLEEHVQRLR